MSNNNTNTFISAQQTARLASMVSTRGDVRTSSPEFNLKPRKADDAVEQSWAEMKTNDFSLPVYSTVVMTALHNLLQTPAIVQKAESLGVTLPVWGFNKMFVRRTSPYKGRQFGAVQALLDFLKQNDDQNSAERIARFLTAAQEFVGDNPTAEGWNALTAEHLQNDWRNLTHYSTALQLFGVSDDLASRARTEDVRGTEMQHACTRWLVQAMNCLTLVNPGSDRGCFTDVVNGIFAMMNERLPGDVADPAIYVANVIDRFRGILVNNSLNSLQWVPDEHVHDAESDDVLLNVIFRVVRDGLGHGPLKTVVQLPEDQTEGDEHVLFGHLEEHFSGQDATTVVRDPDSANAEALSAHWSSLVHQPVVV